MERFFTHGCGPRLETRRSTGVSTSSTLYSEEALLDDGVLSAFSPRVTSGSGLPFATPATSEPFPCLADELEQEAQQLEVHWHLAAEPSLNYNSVPLGSSGLGRLSGLPAGLRPSSLAAFQQREEQQRFAQRQQQQQQRQLNNSSDSRQHSAGTADAAAADDEPSSCCPALEVATSDLAAALQRLPSLNERLPSTSTGPATPTRYPDGSGGGEGSSCNESLLPGSGPQQPEVQSPARPLMQGFPAVPALRSAAARAVEGFGCSSVNLSDLCPGLLGPPPASANTLAKGSEEQAGGRAGDGDTVSGSGKRRADDEAGFEVDASPQGSVSAALGVASVAGVGATASSGDGGACLRRSKRQRTAAAGAGTLAAAIAAAEAAEATAEGVLGVGSGAAPSGRPKAEPQLSSYSAEQHSLLPPDDYLSDGAMSPTLATPVASSAARKAKAAARKKKAGAAAALAAAAAAKQASGAATIAGSIVARKQMQQKQKRKKPVVATTLPKRRAARPMRSASAGVAAAVAAAAPGGRAIEQGTVTPSHPAGGTAQRATPRTPARAGSAAARRRAVLAWTTPGQGPLVDPRTGQRLTTLEPATFCSQCFSTATPVWRAGPFGHKTLCNACGVRWMKACKPRLAVNASALTMASIAAA